MSPTGPAPQFGTAEYASTGDPCKSCKQPISGSYYRINGMLACERCAQQVQQQTPKDTHAAYVRAITFGVGAAILGCALFAGFVIVTGISIGYLALAVGWLIAKAVKMGSGGIGGRRYQIAAAALTYAAVSMAAVPIYLQAIIKDKQERAAHTAPKPTAPKADSQDSGVDNPPLAQAPVPPKPKVNPWSALGLIVLLGLASPFLELQSPFHGLIGLVILFVGIRIAWQLTAGPKLEIMGPFQDSSPGALPSATT
ncbi:MAG TPA: hypothetical protein VKF79_00750 [Candidatus Acidoferrum sp.]|nr:hypothetical protein [Candidatus Acidoferrum sp.]